MVRTEFISETDEVEMQSLWPKILCIRLPLAQSHYDHCLAIMNHDGMRCKIVIPLVPCNCEIY